jgi:RinA family phage transcriptional activator
MTETEYTFKELEMMLSKYKDYLKELNLIELSIRHPIQENNFDTGRKSNVKPNDSMLRTLIKIEECEELEIYTSIGIAIENTFASLPEHQQEAMMEFYINKRNGPFRGHPKRIATKLKIDASTLYRWRVEITNNFASKLNDCIDLHDFDNKKVLKC